MELKQLERFLAVLEHGSLAAAAKHLGLTQQALSASLANLETDLGARLFDRSPGGVTRPTLFGKALVPHARAQLAGAVRAREELRCLAAGRSGTVTVGIGESFPGEIISRAVARLHVELPDVRINLVEGYSEQLCQRLYDGEFDFIAAGVSTYGLDPDFTREPIYAADDIIVARAGHPLAGRSRLQLAELEGYPWLVPYSRASDLEAITACFVAGNLRPPRQVVGSDARHIGLRLLAASDMLLMVSPVLIARDLAGSHPQLVRLDIDRPTVRRNASLIYPRSRPVGAAAIRLLDLVRRLATSDPALPPGQRLQGAKPPAIQG
ncbi:MAG: LysR family transcriptional regulator [Gammaproteobacteria bacterium]|nr:LysR family transcriptional regulator [Gammaproteobacteria bacterium]